MSSSSSSEPRASRPRFRGLELKPRDEGSGLLPWSWAEERLSRAWTFWLATARPDGSPHAMPVWGVWLEGSVLFDTHYLSQKVRNLTHDARAVMHLESGEEVVILEGAVDVEEKVDAGLNERFRAAYGERYGAEWVPDEGYRFVPRLAYAWRNDDFAGSATRFEPA